MRDTFNEDVYAAVNALSIEGVDEAAVIASLVRKHGPEGGFLMYHAAKTYLALPPVEVPPDSGPVSG